ncbi:MAG TPA: phage tail protein [Ruminiclostridium sp.]|nr:phage tail protein [Ruminiclostridium sp.]
MNHSKKDPVGVYRFKVEIDGLQVGGFSEVQGLEMELETEEIKEGGLNNLVHKLPKKIKFSNLIFKKGVTSNSELINWFNNCITGTVNRKNGSVTLNDSEGNPVISWIFLGAYPVKCSWSSLNAKGSQEVAIETVEFIHSGLRIRQKS